MNILKNALLDKGFFYVSGNLKTFFFFILVSAIAFFSSISPVFSQSEDVDTIFEEVPLFPGGDAARVKYLSENIKYPEFERDNNIQGLVIVQCVIEKDGSISGVKVLKSVSPGLDKEAVRVVAQMPTWIPGTQRGKAVRVYVNLPIRFYLSDRKTIKDKKPKSADISR